MAHSIIDSISYACSCSQQQAQQYLNNEIESLRELKDLDDLRSSDFEAACANLGLENDYVEYFLNVLII